MTVVRPPPAAGRPTVRGGARGSVVSLAGAVINGAGGLVLATVIVREYGPIGSGAIFTAIGLVTIVSAACCLGADTGLLWALPRRPGATGTRLRSLFAIALPPPLLFATIVATGGVVAAQPVAATLLEAAGTDGPALLRLAFLAVPVAVAATLLLAAVRAVRPISAYVSVQSVLVGVARPVAVGAMVAAGAGVVAGFGGWLFPLVAATVAAALLLVRPWRSATGAPARPSISDWRVFWEFAAPRAASATIDAGSMWIGVLLTSALAGQAQAGIFAAVGRYALAGLLVMHALRVAVAPRLSRLLATRRRRDAASLYRRATGWIVIVSVPAYLLLAAFAPAFLDLFGPRFRDGAPALAVMAGAMLVNVGVGLVQTVLLMGGDSRAHLAATAAGLTLNVAMCLILAPRIGALGAAIAWAAGIVVENTIAAIGARRMLGEPLLTVALPRIGVGVAAGASVACAAGLLAAGRGPTGLAVALAVLAIEVAVLLTSQRVRAAMAGAGALLRPENSSVEGRL